MQPTPDYRLSHLQRGGSYDDTLAASPFDAYMAHWEAIHLQRLVQELLPNRQARCLDFACGTGRITTTVAPLCASTLGVDVSRSMLESARSKQLQAEFREVDITRDDSDLGQFDLVTSFRFFGNAQDDLRDRVMAALAKRLKPGGLLIVNSHRNPRALSAVFDRLTGGDGDNMDLHPAKLRALMQRHGLRVERQVPIGVAMYRASLMLGCDPRDPAAIRRERLFSSPIWSTIAPDLIVVARKR